MLAVWRQQKYSAALASLTRINNMAPIKIKVIHTNSEVRFLFYLAEYLDKHIFESSRSLSYLYLSIVCKLSQKWA